MKKAAFLFIVLSILLISQESHSYEGGRLRDLKIGETFEFVIRWNGIPVGIVTTAIEGLSEIQGRKAYKVSILARTNDWASLIYKVEDRYLTYIDYETSTSLRYEAYRSEGRYRKKTAIDYIYGRFLAEYHYLKSGRKKTVEVAGNIHDPVSALYYFLRRDFSIDDEVVLNIDLNEKRHRLFVKIGKGRQIGLPALGRFNTIVIRPYLERKGKPYMRGNGLGYISKGADKLPVFAVVTVFPWGRFSATLLSCSASR
ncbi:MAG: DUF3108 domain-containing protein [Candidatus Omnitrophota bacterium]